MRDALQWWQRPWTWRQWVAVALTADITIWTALQLTGAGTILDWAGVR